MENKWQCYVCGKRIENSFYLVAMRESADRAFLVDLECIEEIEDEETIKVKVHKEVANGA